MILSNTTRALRNLELARVCILRHFSIVLVLGNSQISAVVLKMQFREFRLYTSLSSDTSIMCKIVLLIRGEKQSARARSTKKKKKKKD